jgi:hypothetical protein
VVVDEEEAVRHELKNSAIRALSTIPNTGSRA